MRRGVVAALLVVATSPVAPACSGDASSLPAMPCPDAGTPEAAIPDAAPAPTIPPPESPLATNASIAAFTINQGVEIVLTDVVGASSSHRNAPVIAGRPGVARVYVTLANGVTSADLGGELWIVLPGRPPRRLEDKKTITAPSMASDLASTLDFDLPADAIERGSSYRVYLTSNGPAGAATDARLPREGGTASFQAIDTGLLKVRIVPLIYGGDGSGRVPDVGAAHVAKMQAALFGMMPVSGVAIDVHEPLPFAEVVTASTFSRLLAFVTRLRADEGAPPDLYYYGVIQPTEKELDFCIGGCTEGQSSIPWTGTSAGENAAVGTPYDFDRDNRIFVHEMGHALGLSHAPCGAVVGADSRFPYAGARTGAWGYDVAARRLVDPTTVFDVMSYCGPVWISDFDYALLGDRLAVGAWLATNPR